MRAEVHPEVRIAIGAVLDQRAHHGVGHRDGVPARGGEARAATRLAASPDLADDCIAQPSASGDARGGRRGASAIKAASVSGSRHGRSACQTSHAVRRRACAEARPVGRAVGKTSFAGFTILRTLECSPALSWTFVRTLISCRTLTRRCFCYSKGSTTYVNSLPTEASYPEGLDHTAMGLRASRRRPGAATPRTCAG